jgi:FemAB-related protein (PEP-CTERM system-associated)
LVSLPYINTSGVISDDPEVAKKLVEAAKQLADRLEVKALELRHEEQVEVPGIAEPEKQKLHMRLALPSTSEQLWKSFDPKVRNQIRKGEKANLTVHWGGLDELCHFYDIFARNMRDLGTPVFGVELFATILSTFPNHAEVCIVRLEGKPIAGGLLLHGTGITEVPSASSLREYNSTCANMLMYWHLLQRAIGRQQKTFDFGRSSPDSPTYQFKKQWGAQPVPAVWQYYLRSGSAADLRPDNPKFQKLIQLWKKLPVWFTRIIGPVIARGIP